MNNDRVSTVNFEQDIEALLFEQPPSPELFLIYADHLQRQRSPLGEMIALHYALSRTREHDRLVALRQTLAQFLDSHPSLLPQSLLDDLELKLQFGLVRSARIYKSRQECGIGTASEQLQTLLESPCGRMIRSLKVDLANEDQPDPYTVLAAAPSLNALRDLEIMEKRGPFYRRAELLDPLWEAAPRLETLRLRGYCPRVHEFSHERLTCLEIATHSVTEELLRRLIEHRLPSLHELSLHLKSSDENLPIDEGVRELILQLDAPNLKVLRIHQSPHSNLVTSLLPDSTLLRSLTHLDLSNGSLTDEGASLILSNRKAFSHLETLDLSHNWLVDSPKQFKEWNPSILIEDQHPRGNLRLRH